VASDFEQAGLVVIHPDRSDPTVVRGEAWHFNARQLPHLLELPDDFVAGSSGSGGGPAKREVAA
jgi:hypothetical protein